jgi:hypothetical protein
VLSAPGSIPGLLCLSLTALIVCVIILEVMLMKKKLNNRFMATIGIGLFTNFLTDFIKLLGAALG